MPHFATAMCGNVCPQPGDDVTTVMCPSLLSIIEIPGSPHQVALLQPDHETLSSHHGDTPISPSQYCKRKIKKKIVNNVVGAETL